MNPDPSDVRRAWADRSGEFSPRYYAHRGPDDTSERVRKLLARVVGRDARVLEVGCSAGRHLAHLHDAGFTDLHGLDVNPAAVEVLRETYPDLAAAARLHVGDVAAFVEERDAGAFDAVYSVETLQHVPAGTGAFDGLARVTGELLVTVENEDGVADGDVNFVDDGVPLYYRDWGAVFGDRGLVETVEEPHGRDHLRALRPADAAER